MQRVNFIEIIEETVDNLLSLQKVQKGEENQPKKDMNFNDTNETIDMSKS